jgi:predicted phosphodiesterase
MEKPRPLTIVHLSDLHLTAADDGSRSEPKLFGKLRGMNAACRKVLATPAVRDADLVLVTGDVTDRGEPEAWKVFWGAVEAAGLAKKVLVVPGNHDVGCLGFRLPWRSKAYATEGLQRAIDGLRLGNQPTKFPWAVRPDPRLVIFGLNSNNLGEFRWTGAAGGELKYFELERVAGLLHKHRDVPVKIVALHHSPNIPQTETACRRGQKPLGKLERLALQIPQDQRRALRLLCHAAGVRLILHGHVHLSEDRRVGGVRIVGACATTEPVTLPGSLRTGCKPVLRPRHARSGRAYQFHRYTIHGDGCRVTRQRCTVTV